MIESILREYEACSYDFRRHACPEDPLKELFDEWIGYYRMKWAIARVLQPASILGIGVRYGYSARAFLDASSKSAYVGLDWDLPAFGGRAAALAWAERSLRAFDAKFIHSDTRTLACLPGDMADLIHVDDQQDGDGTYHDLNLALDRASYILVDGYFWTRENLLAATEWMSLNRAAIQWAIAIPGYAGELLVKTRNQHGAVAPKGVMSSASLASCYSKRYYLADCGGFAQWQRSRGKSLDDARLRTLAEVSWALATPAKVIDLGAGRGELTRHFAKAGAMVTAVDYSQDAIALIEQTFDGESAIRRNAKLVCDSVTNPAVYQGKFDVAVASDIVEHLSPDELDAMYRLVAEHLDPEDGILVVHTAPNLWNYRYEHARQQRAARRAGCWLPRTRRTYYERLMHINEQSPRVLKRQLMRHFPHVLLWFAGAGGEGGSLLTRFRIGDMRRATDLFAVASYMPIDVDAIRSALQMEPLSVEQSEKLTLRVDTCPQEVEVNGRFDAGVSLRNGCNRMLSSSPPNPFLLSYHWENAKDGSVVHFEGQRTPLLPACRPGVEREYGVNVLAPGKSGRYALKVTPVQEGVRWHESANDVRTIVNVVGDD